jgi:hypothetical protein
MYFNQYSFVPYINWDFLSKKKWSNHLKQGGNLQTSPWRNGKFQPVEEVIVITLN